MLTAYIDDSGTDGNTPFCVLAGFVFKTDSLGEFSDAWRAELQKPPSIRYMKMKEAEGLRGEFKGFTLDQRDHKLLNFVDIALRYSVNAVASLISNVSYHERLGASFQIP
jgi:hypothetical protein